jgi:hypothetical protein
MIHFNQHIESLLSFFKPNMSYQKLDDNPYVGYWYLSPRQHSVEIFVCTLVFIVIYKLTSLSIFHVESKHSKILQMYKKAQPSTVIEKTILGCSIVSLVFIFMSKFIVRQEKLGIFQPCHMNLMLMMLVVILSKKRSITHIVFNYLVHSLYGTILALLFPDLSGLSMFEIINFYVEHYLLLVGPFALLYTKKYGLWSPSHRAVLMCCAINGMYHSIFLNVVSILSGANINYTLVPPPVLMHTFGKFYKIATFCMSPLLVYISRYVVAELMNLCIKNDEKFITHLTDRKIWPFYNKKVQ